MDQIGRELRKALRHPKRMPRRLRALVTRLRNPSGELRLVAASPWRKVTTFHFLIFAADQTNSANRNAAYAKTGRRGAADMDATV